MKSYQSTAMSTPDLRDAFENELRRVLIQNHPNFVPWYETLSVRTREIVDGILHDDVSPELISFSQQIVEEERDAVQFLYVLAGGNPNPSVALALTNFALGDILIEVREFGTQQE